MLSMDRVFVEYQTFRIRTVSAAWQREPGSGEKVEVTLAWGLLFKILAICPGIVGVAFHVRLGRSALIPASFTGVSCPLRREAEESSWPWKMAILSIPGSSCTQPERACPFGWGRRGNVPQPCFIQVELKPVPMVNLASRRTVRRPARSR